MGGIKHSSWKTPQWLMKLTRNFVFRLSFIKHSMAFLWGHSSMWLCDDWRALAANGFLGLAWEWLNAHAMASHRKNLRPRLCSYWLLLISIVPGERDWEGLYRRAVLTIGRTAWDLGTNDKARSFSKQPVRLKICIPMKNSWYQIPAFIFELNALYISLNLSRQPS